jgi:hypothetical protein
LLGLSAWCIRSWTNVWLIQSLHYSKVAQDVEDIQPGYLSKAGRELDLDTTRRNDNIRIEIEEARRDLDL